MSLTLLHSPADVLRQLLVDKGQGYDPASLPADGSGWGVADGTEGDEPDDFVTAYNTAGVADGRAMVTGELLTHYGIQLRVRGRTDSLAFAKAESLRTFLSESVRQDRVSLTSGAVTAGYVVWAAVKIAPAVPLGRDAPDTARYLYTVNLLLSLQRLS